MAENNGEANAGVGELRTKVREKVKELAAEDVDDVDLERWENDDKWVERFLSHNLQDVEHAATMAFECLQWRKKMGVNAIMEQSLSKELLKRGGIYIGTEDKNGNKLLMFRGKLHHKDAALLPEQKKLIIFWMEKLEKAYSGKKVTIIFDMQDAGIGNMDMELTKFIINLFKYYYPSSLAYILVFELPWILNAAWKIIKSWLSTRAVDKIKFVTKTSIQDYIPLEELPIRMGGSSNCEYIYDDGSGSDSASCSDTEPTESASAAKKKVHFANDSEKSLMNEDEVGNHVLFDGHSKAQSDAFDGGLLRISPSDELIFSLEASGDSAGTVHLTNNSENCVAFKVKTTSPEKFRVRPSSGTIKPMCRADVVVQLQFAYQNSNLTRDKFLIMVMEVDKDDIAGQELFELWKSSPKEKIMEHKLRCSLLLPSPTSIRGDDVDSPIPKTTNHVPASMNVKQELEKLHQKIQSLRRLVTLLIFMTLVMMVASLVTLSTVWQLLQPAQEPNVDVEFCNAIHAGKTNDPKLF